MNRKFYKKAIAICVTVIAMLICNCTAFASAGHQTLYLHYFTKGMKDTVNYGYSNDDYKDIKCMLISNTNPSVVGATVIKGSKHNQELKLVGKKIGTSTVKCTYTLDGQKTTWIMKVKVKKYDCPLKKLTIGKTDLAKYFKYNKYKSLNKKSLSGKLNVTLKPGWKITSMYYYKSDNSSLKNTKPGKKITIKKGGILYIGLRYKNTEETVSIQLDLV